MSDYFIFDDIDTRDYEGILVYFNEVDTTPKRVGEFIQIPNRNGSFFLDGGRYEDVTHTYDIVALSKEDASDLINALASKVGYFRLQDSFNTDEFYSAVFNSEIEPKITKERDKLTFKVTFTRKPQRWLTMGEELVDVGEWINWETESGPIVEIEATETDAVKSLVADIDPIQDLNGYDKPWVGGAGKNKAHSGYGWNIGSTGVIVEADFNSCVVKVESGKTYTHSVNGDVTNVGVLAYFSSYPTVGSQSYDSSRIVNGAPTFTAPIDGYAVIRNASSTTNIQVEEGSIATAFEPYENICPISGRTEVVTSVVGKNLIPIACESTVKSGITYTVYKNDSGAVTRIHAEGTSTKAHSFTVVEGYSVSNPFKIKAGSYWFKGLSDGHGGVYDFNIRKYGQTRDIVQATTKVPLVLDEDTDFQSCYFYMHAGKTIDTDIYPMVWSQSETNDDFEPYDGHTITTDLPQTVYGGTLDVVSGELVVTEGYIASYNGESLPSTWISDRDVYASGTIPTTGAQVCYELATPQTYQLTPQQIDLLLGTNNIWADTGDVTLEYGQNPNVIINPTLFESSPLLEVDGGGTISFNGYNIELENGPYGDIQIIEQERDFPRRYQSYIFNSSIANIGDQIKIDLLSVDTIIPSRHSVTFVREDITGSGFNYSYSIGADGLSTHTEMTDVVLTVGTAITLTYRLVVRQAPDYSTAGSISVEYDGNDTITIYVGEGLSYKTSFTNYHSACILTSTKLILEGTIYIDCDLGEAYKIEDGQIVSLNAYIDLGSDLPTLAVGDTEFTFDNTITDLQVVPRWWKI